MVPLLDTHPTEPVPRNFSIRVAVTSFLLCSACHCSGTGQGQQPTTCGTETPEQLMLCVDRARYHADLETIAHPRSPGTPHHLAVRELCATRLADLGFTVERHDYGTGVNILGYRPGTTRPNEHVTISAHYDSTLGCAGADDNATGVAGALETARVLARARFERTLAIACWDEEEGGITGSTAYANLARNATIRDHFVYEMIGYRATAPNSQTLPDGFDGLFPEVTRQVRERGSRGDFIAVVADELHSRPAVDAFTEFAQRIDLPVVVIAVDEALKRSPQAGDLRRSDHAPFWARQRPGIMITDTANFRYPRYHCAGGPDTVDQLDHVFATLVIQATVGAATRRLGLRD